MNYPSTRLFSILELLQTHPQLNGRELAQRLQVDTRTVRRYITTLQDMGLPIETAQGRYGGYKLQQGYKLPPLVFQNDEVLALALGLYFTKRLGISHVIPASERAIRKLEQIMPRSLAEQLQIFSDVVEVETPQAYYQLSGEIVLTLSQATHQQQTVWLRYNGRDKTTTRRKIDPYALVYMIGLWYVTGYCHLRQELRTFRVDRIADCKATSQTFQRPSSFSARQFVEQSIASTPNQWTVEIILNMSEVEARELIPRTTAVYSTVPEGTKLKLYVDDLHIIALRLLRLPAHKLTILSPTELKQTLNEISQQARQLAQKIGVT